MHKKQKTTRSPLLSSIATALPLIVLFTLFYVGYKYVETSIHSEQLQFLLKGALIIFGVTLLFTVTFSSAKYPMLASRTRIEVGADHLGKTDPLPKSTPVILRLNIHGMIGVNDLTQERIEQHLSDCCGGYIRKERVKGIMLHINSQGGGDLDSFGIYNVVEELKKELKIPVYAYVNGLCASGGMYIACAADKIFASPVSKIGSIGVVFGPLLNFSGGLKKLGIESRTISKGKDKDMFNPMRKWKKDEGKNIDTIASHLYEQFIETVSSKRKKLTKRKLKETVGAQIFIAKEAEKQGFIDVADTSYREALKQLAKVAKITHYQLLIVTRKKTLVDEFKSSLPFFSKENALSQIATGQQPHNQFLFMLDWN